LAVVAAISFPSKIDPENRPIRVKPSGPTGTKEILKGAIEAADT